MPRRQPAQTQMLPAVWLVSDARNDARLEAALARLPRGSGLIYRHYHLDRAARRARFERLAALARRRGHLVVLAGTAREARRWKADGFYRAPANAGRALRRGLPLALLTAHTLREVGQARRAGADAIVLSPVFATGSHPGARALGPLRFRLLAAWARAPVIALGGMDAARARRLTWRHWAAIDGLTPGDS